MKDKTDVFPWPMKKREWIFGLIYIPLHMVAVPIIVALLMRLCGSSDEGWLNFWTYLAGVIFCFIFMFSFLKQSYLDALKAPRRFFLVLIWGLLIEYALNVAVTGIFALLGYADELLNPNTETVLELLTNSGPMLAATVILAPILEECLFRGTLFGLIRRKNRILAYIVTIAIFSIYHLAAYMIIDYDSSLWLYLIQYIPPTLALCFVYEKSGSLWCSILLHVLINTIATLASGLL